MRGVLHGVTCKDSLTDLSQTAYISSTFHNIINSYLKIYNIETFPKGNILYIIFKL